MKVGLKEILLVPKPIISLQSIETINSIETIIKFE